MDEESFEEFMEEMLGDEETPDFRVTIRDGRLLLLHWTPWMANAGPLGNLLRQRERDGVTIADLTVVHEDERADVIVSYRALGGDRARAERTLTRWARAVGYWRIWLPDRVLELQRTPRPLRHAEVDCPGCGAHWEDGDPDFWLGVRDQGYFPMSCPICGGDLPQWSTARTVPAVVRRRPADVRADAGRRSAG